MCGFNLFFFVVFCMVVNDWSWFDVFVCEGLIVLYDFWVYWIVVD